MHSGDTRYKRFDAGHSKPLGHRQLVPCCQTALCSASPPRSKTHLDLEDSAPNKYIAAFRVVYRSETTALDEPSPLIVPRHLSRDSGVEMKVYRHGGMSRVAPAAAPAPGVEEWAVSVY